jgi:hypothetical protein
VDFQAATVKLSQQVRAVDGQDFNEPGSARFGVREVLRRSHHRFGGLGWPSAPRRE